MPKLTYKIALSTAAAAVLVITMFFFMQYYEMKKALESPQASILYDRNGEEIFSVKLQYVEKAEIPDFFIRYAEKQSEKQPVLEMIFGDSFFKKTLAKSLMKNIDADELYVNNLYFGSGIVGVGNASHYYFNKEFTNTTPLEKIFLLSKAKSVQAKDAEAEVKKLLVQLQQENYISKADYSTYAAELSTLFTSLYHKNNAAHSYIDLVIDEASEKAGLSEEELFRNHYKIRTNLDLTLQHKLYDVFRNNAAFPENLASGAKIEAGMSIINHQTGAVAGIIGGREYQKTALNRASDITRQPASTFKPLIAFAPALELGWTPDSLLKDMPMKFGNFRPRNYDYKFRSQVSLGESLAMSYNVPTVWLLYKIGFENGFDYIEKFNLFHVSKSEGLPLALGYTKVGTSPLAMAQAYTVFPNEGKMVEVHTIRSIKTKIDWPIYRTKKNTERIFKKDTAAAILELMKKVVTEGTGKSAELEDKWVAAKTGTTSYDNWFIGITDMYVSAIWLGPDEVVPENRVNLFGESYPAKLFKKVWGSDPAKRH